MLPQTQYSFQGLINYLISTYANPLIAILIAAGLAVFFWGIVKYIASAGDKNSFRRGRELMVWGVVALFVMLCFWGLALLLNQTLFGY